MIIRKRPVVGARVVIRPPRVQVQVRPALRPGLQRVIAGPRFGRPVVRPRIIGPRIIMPRVIGPRVIGPRIIAGPQRRYWTGGRWVTAGPVVDPHFPDSVPVPTLDGSAPVPTLDGSPTPFAAYPRRWIFRRPPPSWLLRLLTPYGVAYQPPPEAAEPPADEPTAPHAADASPQLPGAAGPAGSPPDFGQSSPDVSGGAPAAPGGEEPATGELPAMVRVDGQNVPIRWANAIRELGDAVPRGGGVYVVLRDGVPQAAHLTNDFASDLSRRYAARSEDDAFDGDGEWEGARRRRSSVIFGRPGRGRIRRKAFLRSLRSRLGMQQSEPEPPEQ